MQLILVFLSRSAIIIILSSLVPVNKDEIYILNLHQTLGIRVIHLIKDLNSRIDRDISTRLKDITTIVNSVCNTTFTETTVQETIDLLNNGEMNRLLHSFNIGCLISIVVVLLIQFQTQMQL